MKITRDGLELHVNASDVFYLKEDMNKTFDEADDICHSMEKALYYKSLLNEEKHPDICGQLDQLDRRLSTLRIILERVNALVPDNHDKLGECILDIEYNLNKIEKIFE